MKRPLRTVPVMHALLPPGVRLGRSRAVAEVAAWAARKEKLRGGQRASRVDPPKAPELDVAVRTRYLISPERRFLSDNSRGGLGFWRVDASAQRSSAYATGHGTASCPVFEGCSCAAASLQASGQGRR